MDSVDIAEGQIREFDDFLVTLDAQGDRCELVKRITLIEQKFRDLQGREGTRGGVGSGAAPVEPAQRRRETIKVNTGDILANRRQERERRKTQEISLMRPSASEDAISHTLPRKERAKTAVISELTCIRGKQQV